MTLKDKVKIAVIIVLLLATIYLAYRIAKQTHSLSLAESIEPPQYLMEAERTEKIMKGRILAVKPFERGWYFIVEVGKDTFRVEPYDSSPEHMKNFTKQVKGDSLTFTVWWFGDAPYAAF